jgi:hypothetical protein
VIGREDHVAGLIQRESVRAQDERFKQQAIGVHAYRRSRARKDYFANVSAERILGSNVIHAELHVFRPDSQKDGFVQRREIFMSDS